ncbi:MAG: hypothetical protein JO156_16910 [Solirubrobacterales bacterium]|nr:hypothetical protein [Solirubrobacterales bacterium]
MHAVLVNVRLSDNPDPTILREQVVPRVRELPGFVAGYWTRGDGVGRSVVVFDSEENAKAASDLVPSLVPSGTTIEDNDVSEVVAHA